VESGIGDGKKRITTGVVSGIILVIISAGLYSIALFMASLLVFGCVKSPPDWVYMILFAGFPVPLLAASVTAPYLYIKKQHFMWIILSFASGIFLSCLIFLIWFLILTRYC
jgi:hypothetical protein